MLAISFIVGQLNTPIAQLIEFLREVQDAKISLERLGEIHNLDDEEGIGKQKISVVRDNVNLRPIIKNMNFTVPARKITAIVGLSGSGKTTLLKLLLKFYEPETGKIEIGSDNLTDLSQRAWRSQCGVVMQEGYIFNDTIANNIAIGEDHINENKLLHAVKIANIQTYIDELPLGFNTKIGLEGTGLSTGQKQRLLIARAVYKNP